MAMINKTTCTCCAEPMALLEALLLKSQVSKFLTGLKDGYREIERGSHRQGQWQKTLQRNEWITQTQEIL